MTRIKLALYIIPIKLEQVITTAAVLLGGHDNNGFSATALGKAIIGTRDFVKSIDCGA